MVVKIRKLNSSEKASQYYNRKGIADLNSLSKTDLIAIHNFISAQANVKHDPLTKENNDVVLSEGDLLTPKVKPALNRVVTHQPDLAKKNGYCEIYYNFGRCYNMSKCPMKHVKFADTEEGVFKAYLDMLSLLMGDPEMSEKDKLRAKLGFNV